jgi:hypothetical protein
MNCWAEKGFKNCEKEARTGPLKNCGQKREIK